MEAFSIRARNAECYVYWISLFHTSHEIEMLARESVLVKCQRN